jgi:hypothetical protein
MDACRECYVLSGIYLCDELITRREESYRLWCLVECDLETSWMRFQANYNTLFYIRPRKVFIYFCWSLNRNELSSLSVFVPATNAGKHGSPKRKIYTHIPAPISTRTKSRVVKSDVLSAYLIRLSVSNIKLTNVECPVRLPHCWPLTYVQGYILAIVDSGQIPINTLQFTWAPYFIFLNHYRWHVTQWFYRPRHSKRTKYRIAIKRKTYYAKSVL